MQLAGRHSQFKTIVIDNQITSSNETWQRDFSNLVTSLPDCAQAIYHIYITAGWVAYIFGHKWTMRDGSFYIIRGSGDMTKLAHLTNDGELIYDS